jgi:hypothetical protein
MNLRVWETKHNFLTNFLLWEKYKNNFSLSFHYFCDSCSMYAYDILPKFFSSGILARAMNCNILTKHSNRSYVRSIPKFQVTFWSPFNKRFIFNVRFTMASISGLMRIGPIVKLLLICKWKLVFYINKHKSINVGWKIVTFILKKISFDNIAFEDVFVLRAADTRTSACRSLLSGKVLAVRGKRCIGQVIAAVVIGTGSDDELLHLHWKHLLSGSFNASTARLRPRRSNRPYPTTLGSGGFELCRTWYGIRVVVHAAIHGCVVALCPRARMYVALVIRGRLKWTGWTFAVARLSYLLRIGMEK